MLAYTYPQDLEVRLLQSISISKNVLAFVVIFTLSATSAQATVHVGSGVLAIEDVEHEQDRGVLRIRNNTPFILTIYIAGMRAGWIKPFRTELFRGLKDGIHTLHALSQYGSAFWGPEKLDVPGTWNVTVGDDKQTGDLDTALASRIYRTNKNSLVACGKLADRRGEQVKGTRVELSIKVDDQGKGVVSVKGEQATPKLLSCYRTIVKQWKFPKTGKVYQLSFLHLER